MPRSPAFDPDGDYVAAKAFRYAGRPHVAGMEINKAAGDPRTLQLLYDQHYIDTDADAAAKREAAEAKAKAKADQLEQATKDADAAVPLTDDQKARVEQLVADNDRAALEKLATEAGVAEPDKLANKGAVAEAIVRAEAAKAAAAAAPQA